MITYRRTTVEGSVHGKNPPEAFLTERGPVSTAGTMHRSKARDLKRRCTPD